MRVEYQGDLRTISIHERSGNSIITDAPPDNHGKGEAFSPTDLIAVSLVTCMITLMGIKANGNGWKFEVADAEVEKIMASNPRRVSELKIKMKVRNENYDDRTKQVLTETAIHCPVAKSLDPEINQSLELEYV